MQFPTERQLCWAESKGGNGCGTIGEKGHKGVFLGDDRLRRLHATLALCLPVGLGEMGTGRNVTEVPAGSKLLEFR